jgi:transposase-like protein
MARSDHTEEDRGGVDLRSVLYSRSQTPEEDRTKCPGCGSTTTYRKQRGEPRGENNRMRGDYRCGSCGKHFTEREAV